MTYNFEEAALILARTPAVLNALLKGLGPNWVMNDESPGMWSPYDVVGHLIEAEKSNWLPRARVILERGEAQPFAPFDRFAMFGASEGTTLDVLLEEFSAVRAQSLTTLRQLELTERDLEKTGTHPELGLVTLRELLATWVVHDFTHFNQIVRTMARRYETNVGPWQAYLSILKRRS